MTACFPTQGCVDLCNGDATSPTMVCQKNNIELKERKINIDNLMEAQEVFLTSSTGFVLPVIEIDGRHVGNGLVGNMAKEIQKIYLEQIKAKLS